MSDNDIEVIKDLYGTYTFDVASGAAVSIGPGEPVVRATNYVALITNGMPTTATDYLVGIAAQDSTDTAAAAGTVLVTLAGPLTMIWGKGSFSGTANNA